MEITVITVMCSIISVFCTAFGLIRNRTKDIRSDTKEDAILSTKLDYISKGVDDIRLDNKARDRQIQEIVKDLIEVKSSTKSAHHRLDTLENRLDKKGDDKND